MVRQNFGQPLNCTPENCLPRHLYHIHKKKTSFWSRKLRIHLTNFLVRISHACRLNRKKILILKHIAHCTERTEYPLASTLLKFLKPFCPDHSWYQNDITLHYAYLFEQQCGCFRQRISSDLCTKALICPHFIFPLESNLFVVQSMNIAIFSTLTVWHSGLEFW